MSIRQHVSGITAGHMIWAIGLGFGTTGWKVRLAMRTQAQSKGESLRVGIRQHCLAEPAETNTLRCWAQAQARGREDRNREREKRERAREREKREIER